MKILRFFTGTIVLLIMFSIILQLLRNDVISEGRNPTFTNIMILAATILIVGWMRYVTFTDFKKK